VGILKSELDICGSILQNSAIARVPWAFAYVFFWLAFGWRFIHPPRNAACLVFKLYRNHHKTPVVFQGED
jgi:hypothetical protein